MRSVRLRSQYNIPNLRGIFFKLRFAFFEMETGLYDFDRALRRWRGLAICQGSVLSVVFVKEGIL